MTTFYLHAFEAPRDKVYAVRVHRPDTSPGEPAALESEFAVYAGAPITITLPPGGAIVITEAPR